MRALLEDRDVIDVFKTLPDFRELRGDQFAEKRADADVREIISAPADSSPVRRVIAVLRMIESLFHEPGERLRTVIVDLASDELD